MRTLARRTCVRRQRHADRDLGAAVAGDCAQRGRAGAATTGECALPPQCDSPDGAWPAGRASDVTDARLVQTAKEYVTLLEKLCGVRTQLVTRGSTNHLVCIENMVDEVAVRLSVTSMEMRRKGQAAGGLRDVADAQVAARAAAALEHDPDVAAKDAAARGADDSLAAPASACNALC